MTNSRFTQGHQLGRFVLYGFANMVSIPFSSSVSCIIIQSILLCCTFFITRCTLDSFVVIAEEEFSNNIPSFVLQSWSALLPSYVYPKSIHSFNPPFFCSWLAGGVHPFIFHRYFDSRSNMVQSELHSLPIGVCFIRV